MSKALVCGSGGFIGGHLSRELERRKLEVFGVDMKPRGEWFQEFGVTWENKDLRDPEVCDRLINYIKPDYVFNLAADMGGMGFIENNKAACMESVLINTNLLRSVRGVGLDRYFYASSACVYNASKQNKANVTALREEDAYPAMPEDGYGWEKLFSERMCRHFREDYQVPTRIARFHNVYGPHGTYQGGREKAPAAICRKVIKAKLSGKNKIEIWGDGEQTRSFMFIDDCVEGIIRIAAGDYADPLNLGSSELVSINQLVSMVEEIAGVKLERRYKKDAPKGVRGRNSDNRLIQKVLRWSPSISLREGMEKTYRWIYEEMTKV